MSLRNIREQIAVILSAVDGVGVVHQYERLATDWKKFLDLYKDPNGKINGWSITRQRTSAQLLSWDEDTIQTHHFVIRGIYGLQDEAGSELVFQDMIEAITEAFRTNDDLNGTCLNTTPTSGVPGGATESISGIQAEVVEQKNIGGVLCHYCELHLVVQESSS